MKTTSRRRATPPGTVKRHGRSGVRRRLRGAFAAGAALAAGTVVLAGPASATVWHNGGVAQTWVACNKGLDEIRLTEHLMPESQFSSETVAVRLWLSTDGQTWVPKQWTTYRAPYLGTVVVPSGVVGDINVHVYMEYTWFDGQAWTMHQGEYITSYTEVYGASSYPSSICTV